MDIGAFLYELYNKETSAESRRFLVALQRHYEESSTALTIAALLEKLEGNITAIVEVPKEGDYRLKKLKLTNFRKFPKSNSGKPYGIDFEKEGAPVSMYMVGTNGTGKSSIYAALEYVYNKRISSKEERGYTKNIPYEVYGLGRISGIGKENVCVEVTTPQRGYIFDPENNQFPSFPRAMFCSDTDVRVLQEEDDFTRYALNELGYAELLTLENELLKLKSDIDTELKKKDSEKSTSGELYDADARIDAIMLLPQIYGNNSLYKRCEKALSICREFLKRYEEYPLEEDEFKEKYLKQLKDLANEGRDGDMLKRLLLDLQSHYKSLEGGTEGLLPGSVSVKSELLEPLKRLKKTLELVCAVDLEGKHDERLGKIRDRIVSLKLEERIKKEYVLDTTILGTWPKIIDNILVEILGRKGKALKDLEDTVPLCEMILNAFSPKDERFSIMAKKTSIGDEEVILSYDVSIEKIGAFSASPREYYNTFRFRLYVLMLKVALTIAYMKLHKCRIPFVMDDMLNASDIDNSRRIETLVQKIYEEAYRVLEGKHLQIILLTHDGVIQHAFRNGSRFVPLGDNRIENAPCAICRLFDYQHSEQIQKELNLKKLDYEPISILL